MRKTLFLAGIILVLGIIGLISLVNSSTNAQGPQKIDIRSEVVGKHFNDGRRVPIATLPTGEKIVSEIERGKFKKWFLVLTDGTEVAGKVERAKTTTTMTVTCTAVYVTTTTDSSGTTKTTSKVHQIPCPETVTSDGYTDTFHDPDATVNPFKNSNKPKL